MTVPAVVSGSAVGVGANGLGPIIGPLNPSGSTVGYKVYSGTVSATPKELDFGTDSGRGTGARATALNFSNSLGYFIAFSSDGITYGDNILVYPGCGVLFDDMIFKKIRVTRNTSDVDYYVEVV